MNLKGKQVIAEFDWEEKPTTEELCTVAAVSGGRIIAVRHSDGELVSLDPTLPLRLVDHDRALRRLDPEMDATEAKAVADHATDLQAKLEETAKRCGQLRTDLATEMRQGLELRDQVNQAVTRILAAVPGWFASPPPLDIAVDALLRAMSGRLPSDDEIRVLVGARDEETTTDAVRRRVDGLVAEGAALSTRLAEFAERWRTDVSAAHAEINKLTGKLEGAAKEAERHKRMRQLAEHDRDQAEQDAEAMSSAIGRLTAARQAAEAKVAELTTGRPFVDVVFDGPPGPDAGRFVEVEDDAGKSINAGEWIDRKDGMWALRIPLHAVPQQPAANRTDAELSPFPPEPAPDSGGRPARNEVRARPTIPELEAMVRGLGRAAQFIEQDGTCWLVNRGEIYDSIVSDALAMARKYEYVSARRAAETAPEGPRASGQDAPVSHGRALSTALVEAIAAGRAGYRVNPDDAIRHAQALASEVLAYRAASVVHAEQPVPKYDPAKPDVWEMVIRAASHHAAPPDLIAAMRARRAIGIARYGSPLQPHNGRSARRDLLEELLDATAYSGQDALERGTDLTDPLFMYILGLLVRVHKESVRPA